MNWIKENMSCVGRVLGAVLLGLSVITAVFALDGRWVKQNELQAMEQKTVKTLEQFEQRQDRKYLEQRQQTLTDQMMTQRQLMKKYPNDPEVKEDYQAIKEERDKVKEEINRAK
jgi:hypothetical protein